MRRLGHTLRSAPAFFVAAWPPFGALLLAASNLFGRPHHPAGFVRTWLLAWGPLLTLGSVHALLGVGGDAAWPWAGLAIVLGWLVVGTRAPAFGPLLLGLSVAVAALAAERGVAATTWHPTQADTVALERYRAVLDGQTLRGGEAYERVWRGSTATGATTVRLEMRREAGTQGWSWYPYDPAFVQEPLLGFPEGYARVTTPVHGGSYVTRRIHTGAPLAGRTFRARLRLRASQTFDAAATACRGILLREVGGTGANACFETRVDTVWSDHEVTWRAPDDATASALRIELRIATAWFEVGDVRLEEATPDGWRPLGPLEPAGVRVAVVVPYAPPVEWITQVELPTTAWRSVTLRVEDPRLAPDADLRVIIQAEAGTTIEVRRAAAERWIGGASPVRLTPSPRPIRGSGWFEHPNLAGHGLALTGLLTASLAPTPIGAIGAAVATLAGVALTGSRAAWAVAVAGLVALAIGARRRQPARPGGRRPFVPLLIGLVAVATLVGVSLRGSTPAAIQVLGRGAGNEVPRTEILAFALRTMLAHPLGGIGEDGFAAHWEAAHPTDGRTAPQHGHNLWAHLGATYGLPGFAVAAWLSVVLLGASRRWGGRRGQLVVAAALALQLTDVTLAHTAVYVPLLVALTRADPPPP